MATTRRTVTIKYLEAQLIVYMTAREFGEMKLRRLDYIDSCIDNPTSFFDRQQYKEQIERCTKAIDEINECIRWVKALKTDKSKPKTE